MSMNRDKYLERAHHIHDVLDDTDNYILIENIKNWDHSDIKQLLTWLDEIRAICQEHHITLDDVGLEYDKMYVCVLEKMYNTAHSKDGLII